MSPSSSHPLESAKQSVQGAYTTASHGVEGVYATAEHAARQVLPTSVVDKLQGVGVLKENSGISFLSFSEYRLFTKI